ncbi:MAG: hypothetical protein JW768_07315 [Chitinispirillaceae bacterium]|nr:hypothetical protein [Chitinispirillaceae bacterium]
MEGCSPAYNDFLPRIAVRPVTLLLPAGHKALSMDVDYSEPILLDGTFQLDPHIPAVNKMHRQLRQVPDRYRSLVYARNAFYPATPKSGTFRTQYKNGHPLFVSSLFPVQYNPVTGKIRYFKKITVTITTTPSIGLFKSADEAPLPPQCTPAIKSQLGIMVDNADAVASVPLTARSAASYEYLIITTDALKNSWAEFIAFNRRRGMRTEVHTIQEIKADATITGADDAAKMRAFIKREYQNKHIIFVLLGGGHRGGGTGSADLPRRLFHAQYYDCWVAPNRFFDYNNILTDMYYGALDGTWKDSSGKTMPYYGDPGTEDMNWEVYVTRFPCENTTDVANMVRKTIAYSEAPVASQLNRLFLAGNYLWTEPGKPAVYGDDYSEEYYDSICTHNSFATFGYPKSQWVVKRCYDRQRSWGRTQILDTFRLWRPHIFEHEGHANYTSSFSLSIGDVTTSNFNNDGTSSTGNFFIITTGSCQPAGFDYSGGTCFLAMFMRISTGAVAVQGFTRNGMEDDDTTDGPGQRIRRFFHDGLFNPAKAGHYYEMALTNARESNSSFCIASNPASGLTAPPYFGAIRYCMYAYTNLGDPALSIWTKPPQTLSVTPAISAAGVLSVQTGGPWSMVAVCDRNGQILNAQMTGLNGQCSMNEPFMVDYFKSNAGASLKVFIKAHNYLPCSTTVTVPAITAVKSAKGAELLSLGALAAQKNKVRVAYSLEQPQIVSITLLDVRGAKIRTLASGMERSGKHAKTFSLDNLANGIYYCAFKAGNTEQVRKVVLAR